jgi:hypothetical protein
MSDYIIEDMNYSREDISELFEIKSNGYGTLAGAYTSALFFGVCNLANASVVREISKADFKPTIEYVIAEPNDFSLEDYENVFLNDYCKYLINTETSDKKKRETIESILSFKSLQESWDGYGALPLEVKSATNAIEFLETLDLNSKFFTPTDIFPNPAGTVSLIWENDESERVSLEIGNDAFSYYTKFNNIEPEFFNDVEINNVSIGNITRKIQAIY